MDRRGFSLIELLMVVSIIGILSTIAITGYIGQQRRAARSEAYANLQNLRLLEEQFFAENADYTATVGAAGTSAAIRDANLTAMQNVLRGFRPGTGTVFSYRVQHDVRLPNPPLDAPFTAAVVNQVIPPDPPCFVAYATGVTGTSVNGDIFVIDCFNNRNF